MLVMAAVSGGPDSTALLLCLNELAEELSFRLCCAHVNHGLRPEAADDEAFVRDLAAHLGVTYECRRCCVPEEAQGSGVSLETAARNARLRELRAAAGSIGADRIALGHTADDRVETVLMNVFRGTGLRGLSAMRWSEGPIVRPLLSTSRETTLCYCVSRGVTPRLDPSNYRLSFRRNRIRHELLPYLEAFINPSVRAAVLRLAEMAEDEDVVADEIARSAFHGCVRTAPGGAEAVLSAEALARLPMAIRRRLLRQAIEAVGGCLEDAGFEAIQTVLHAALSEPTRPCSWTLPSVGVRLRVSGGITVERLCPLITFEPVVVPIPGEVTVGAADLKVQSEEVDLQELPRALSDDCLQVPSAVLRPPVWLRPPQPGDRVRPLGLGGSKKLSDCMTDRKVPRTHRSSLPVLADAAGVLWVPGVVADERVRVQEIPCRCVRFRIVKKV